MAAPITDVRGRSGPAAAGGDAFWFEAPPEPEPEPEPVAVAEPWPEPEPIVTPDELEPFEPPEFHVASYPEPAAELAYPEPWQPADPAWGWTEPWGFEVPSEGPPTRTPRRQFAHGGATGTIRGVVRRGRGPLLVLALAALVTGATIGSTKHAPLPHRAGSARPNPTTIAIVPAPSALALRTIPAGYLRLYVRAAGEYGLDWTMLAAVGQVESHSGASSLPGVATGTNYAGAAGPAQFLASTWERFGVDVHGRGRIDPYDPADAITAMAAYLKASGAPQDWQRALYTYNHSHAYVANVIALSQRLHGTGGSAD